MSHEPPDPFADARSELIESLHTKLAEVTRERDGLLQALQVLEGKPAKARALFRVVASERDEYPGDGLYLVRAKDIRWDTPKFDKMFLNVCNLNVREGDEIEVTARVVSREVVHREPVDE